MDSGGSGVMSCECSRALIHARVINGGSQSLIKRAARHSRRSTYSEDAIFILRCKCSLSSSSPSTLIPIPKLSVCLIEVSKHRFLFSSLTNSPGFASNHQSALSFYSFLSHGTQNKPHTHTHTVKNQFGGSDALHFVTSNPRPFRRGE